MFFLPCSFFIGKPFLIVSMRTWNRTTGIINVFTGVNSQLTLRSYQNDGSITVQTTAWINLGGENHFHYQNGTITGMGRLGFGLGNHNLSTNFSSGSLDRILCFGGYYFSGTGSITTTSSTTLYLYAGWTTIPITINGYSFFYYNPRTTNTITVNYILKWMSDCVNFGTNGKINISANAELYLNSAGSTIFDVGATNFGITNCGTIICNADVNFTVPYTNCVTSIVKGTGNLNSATGHTIYHASPGASPGTLILNPSVTSASTAVFDMEIWNTGTLAAPIMANDLLVSDGNIQLAGTLNILTSGSIPNGTYPIIQSNMGTVTGIFPSVKLNGGALPSNYKVTYSTNSVSIDVSTVLPLELLTFQAQNTEGPNKLTWQTATEKNTSHFDIEKSKDGLAFEKIGEVKAAGNSQTPQYYSYLDKNPYDLSYYRLKINDLDGKSEYSKVVNLTAKVKGFTAKVYPNPLKDQATIELTTEQKTDVTIELYDMIGRQVKRLKAENTEGVVTMPFDMKDLSSGTYFLKISNNTNVIQQKIVKQE
jgi:hypothetical protein